MLSRFNGMALKSARPALTCMTAVASQPCRFFGVRDPYAEVETVEDDQAKIKEFLSKYKLTEHADKFKSWEHLIMSRGNTLKHHMQFNVRDRRKLRKKAYNWRMTQYYSTGVPFVPAGPNGLGLVDASRPPTEVLLSSSEEELSTILPMESTVGFFSAFKHYSGARHRESRVILPSSDAEQSAEAPAEATAANAPEAFMQGVLSDAEGSALNAAVAQAVGDITAADEAAKARQALQEAADGAASAAVAAAEEEEALAAAGDGLTASQRIALAAYGRAGRAAVVRD
jgi:hypothetical protein